MPCKHVAQKSSVLVLGLPFLRYVKLYTPSGFSRFLSQEPEPINILVAFFEQHPEAKQVQCKCGWEDAVGKGIQEGYIGVLKEQFGFITQDFPRERNPRGIFFHQSDLKGCSIRQLNIGDRVHFRVEQSDKGCVAKQIDVLTPVVQAVRQVILALGRDFFQIHNLQGNI